jgi:hypothetical protein
MAKSMLDLFKEMQKQGRVKVIEKKRCPFCEEVKKWNS